MLSLLHLDVLGEGNVIENKVTILRAVDACARQWRVVRVFVRERVRESCGWARSIIRRARACAHTCAGSEVSDGVPPNRRRIRNCERVRHAERGQQEREDERVGEGSGQFFIEGDKFTGNTSTEHSEKITCIR